MSHTIPIPPSGTENRTPFMIIRILLAVSFCFLITNLSAQNKPVIPSETGAGVFLGITKSLRDIPALTPEEVNLLKSKAESVDRNEELREREYPFSNIALPRGEDAVWQKSMGKASLTKSKASTNIFEGQSTSSYPPDCNGAAGPNHFMQAVNTTYAIFDKTGVKLAGPTSLSQLFLGVAGASCDDGDPIILFDEQADRWLVTEFSLCDSTHRLLMAVSATNDPTGAWYAYSFDVADMPDYPKFSVWQDGYYMGDNNNSRNDIYVFERSKMLVGEASPKFAGFRNAWRPGSVDDFMCAPPVDNDGVFAPAGSPGLFIAMSDDAFNSGTDQLWIYELAVNWTTLSASTFNRVQQLDVSPFDSNFGTDWTNIKQLGTTQELDAIPQVIMNVPQYRNFGAYQTIVCCHSVDVDKTDHAGIRWYELRKTPPSTTWVVRQQGTFAPDIYSRWMGSIMLNGKNEIGVGYSVSGSTLYPGIRYCGQTDIEYNNASGILDLPEGIILNGTASQTGTERWGDYSQMSVDPVNDSTFWFTSEYVGVGIRKTKIASFQVERVPPTAYITANDTLPCLNTGTVTFTSEVTGSPTKYVWSIMPETYTYANGTDSSTHNPQVIFNAYGNYSVTLTVTNIVGSTTVTKTDYIHVNDANAYFTMNSATVVKDNFITFTDATTCSPTTWAWDFGDGASPRTANTQGPHSVSYSSTGLKSISLLVNGNSAGEKTRSVNVVEADISMSSTTVATCSGTFYDPGGPADNYANNQDYTMLFKPGYPGGKLDFEFMSFNIESQTTCTNDFLKIYDGENISSPLIGTYCGTIPPGIIRATNTAGALLFVFHSNSTTTQPGWAATIGCSGVNALNPASITATAASSTAINIAWAKNALDNDVLLAWSPDEIFGVPSSGTSYTVGDLIPGGGTILLIGSGTTYSHSGLTPSTPYYYKAFSVDAALKYSSGISVNTSTQTVTSIYNHHNEIKGLRIYPNPAKGLFSIVVDKLKYPKMQVIITNINGVALISRECKGESEYEFDLSKSPLGTYFVKIITDNELMVTKLVIIE